MQKSRFSYDATHIILSRQRTTTVLIVLLHGLICVFVVCMSINHCISCVMTDDKQKRSGRPRKSWDEVIENDRKKLDMDSADPQNRSEWRGRLRERRQAQPLVE